MAHSYVVIKNEDEWSDTNAFPISETNISEAGSSGKPIKQSYSASEATTLGGAGFGSADHNHDCYPKDESGALDLRVKKTGCSEKGKVPINTHNKEAGIKALPPYEQLVVAVDLSTISSDKCVELKLKVSPLVRPMAYQPTTRGTQCGDLERVSAYQEVIKHEPGTSTSDSNGKKIEKEKKSCVTVAPRMNEKGIKSLTDKLCSRLKDGCRDLANQKKHHSDKSELSREGVSEKVKNSDCANSEQQLNADINNRNGSHQGAIPEVIERSTKRPHDNVYAGDNDQYCQKVLKVSLKKLKLSDEDLARFKEPDINSKVSQQHGNTRFVTRTLRNRHLFEK